MMSLYEKFNEYFNVGVAVNERTIKSHKEIIVPQFNVLTAENEMKFESVSPSLGVYDFTKADKILDFAKENNKKLRGHTLVWHNQTPDWYFKENGSFVSREEMIKRMDNHMRAISKHVKDACYAWDVVNEAIDDKYGNYLRQSNWTEIIGDDFIEKAFLCARNHFPNAMLYYNDYNESNRDKCEKICKLIKSLKTKDIPIDGIGLQAHWNIFSPTIEEIKKAFFEYSKLGVKLSITELDVSVYEFEDKRTDLIVPTNEMIEKQERFYLGIFEIFKEYSEIIDCVTFWGVSDDVTWLNNFPVKNRKNFPLLFDSNQNTKPIYKKLLEKV